MKVTVPLKEPFRSAIGIRNDRLALFVIWFDKHGNWGIGECSCRPDPFFNGEFLDGAVAVIRDFIFPLLPAAASLAEINRALGKIRNWPFTRAAVLDAALDLLRRTGHPDLLDAMPGERVVRIPVGISLGLFASPGQAVQRVRRAVEEGYRRVKLKISPSMDWATLAAIRSEFPQLHLGFDANGSFTADDLDFLFGLAKFDPVMVEQPFAPHRLDLCVKLKQKTPDLKICLDESISSIGELITAHQVHAFDELNVKPGRLGGAIETVRILAACKERGIPAWVGGMFETGVGRLANLRVASCLPDAQAHDLSPASRYFARDVVKQPVTMDADGFIELRDDSPIELDNQALAEFQTDKWTLAKKEHAA
ncbi:MAG: o-succinylbenzoate synthase [bacterium]